MTRRTDIRLYWDKRRGPPSVREVLAILVRRTIDHHKGVNTMAARSLGIGRSTLYKWLREWNDG